MLATASSTPAQIRTQRPATAQPARPHAHPHPHQRLCAAAPLHRDYHQNQHRRGGPLRVTTGSSTPYLSRSHGGGKSPVVSTIITTPRTTPTAPTLPLPAVLAGAGGTALLVAAAFIFGPQHDEVVVSSVGAVPLQERGPIDLASQALGPGHPLWALLQRSTSASAVAHLPFSGGNAHEAVALLVSEARGVAEGAVAAARGTVICVCEDYNSWLEESPLMCKIVTSNVFTLAGDMLAQLVLGGGGGHGCDDDTAKAQQLQANGRRRVDWMRTGRLCLEMALFETTLAHFWYEFLDTRVMPDNPFCAVAVVTKTLADQIIFAPVSLVVFFVVMKCLELRPRDVPRTLRTSFVKTLLGGYLLWPLATVVNFALLPTEYRVLFINIVNIIWTCFLSIMSSGGGEKHEPKPASVATATAAPSAPAGTPAPLMQQPAAAAPTPPSHASCMSAFCVATYLAKAAVAAAAISAAAGDRPAFGCVAGIAVAVIKSSLETHGSARKTGPVPHTLS